MKAENLIETKIGNTILIEYKTEYTETGDFYVSTVGRIHDDKQGKFGFQRQGSTETWLGYTSYEAALNVLLKVGGLK